MFALSSERRRARGTRDGVPDEWNYTREIHTWAREISRRQDASCARVFRQNQPKLEAIHSLSLVERCLNRAWSQIKQRLLAGCLLAQKKAVASARVKIACVHALKKQAMRQACHVSKTSTRCRVACTTMAVLQVKSGHNASWIRSIFSVYAIMVRAVNLKHVLTAWV